MLTMIILLNTLYRERLNRKLKQTTTLQADQIIKTTIKYIHLILIANLYVIQTQWLHFND